MLTIGVFLLLALPWINPFTLGPAPGVVPWLFSLACVAVIVALRAGSSQWMSQDSAIKTVAAAWLAAATLSAVIGLIQYFGVSDVFAPWINITGTGEAFGNLRQRNQYASLTTIGLAALLFWVSRGLPLPLAVVAATLLASGNFASSSRTGLAQWVLLILLAALGQRRRNTGQAPVLMVAALAYVGAVFVLPYLAGLDPLNSGALARLRGGEAACAGRTTLWSNVLHLVAQKPLWGWGWGELSFAHFTTVYPGPRFCDILDNAHNLPLHLAVELGLPFALAVCAAGAWLVARARPWREVDPARQMAWMVLTLIGIHSLLEYPLWYGPFQMAVGASLWILWRRPALAGLTNNHLSVAITRAFWAAPAAAMLLAACAYAAWDYWRVSQLYQPAEARAAAYRNDTLSKLRGSWLFRNQVQFAELTTTPLQRDNAGPLHDLALQLLHFSPEPRVVEKLVESAHFLDHKEEVAYYSLRYRLAFPDAYAQWSLHSGRDKTP